MRVRLGAVMLGLALAACAPRAKLVSTLPLAAPPPPVLGPAPAALPAGTARLHLAQLAADLRQRTAAAEPALPRTVDEAPERLRVQLGAADSFEPDSAQLRVSALATWAALAAALREPGAAVVHVLVYDAPETDVEPHATLAARRAASVASDLRQNGVPGGRLRAEGRSTEGAPRLDLVVRPILEGREPDAWMPPDP